MSSHSEDPTKKTTIAIDFDGVIHEYSKGWYIGVPYDHPMPGAFETIVKLLTKHHVFILSTRNPHHIAKWLDEHKAPFRRMVIDRDYDSPFWDEDGVVGITQLKLAAVMYIDDRALRFTNWRDIKNYMI
jgi:hypothetical protein